jgi:Sec-independent protein secretion pathway component TatC
MLVISELNFEWLQNYTCTDKNKLEKNAESCRGETSIEIYNFHGILLQVPVIQLLLGQVGLVSSDQMLSIWRYVVVGAVVAAAVLTPSTDPLTQMLLAGPLLGLYLGGAWMVKLIGR